MLIVVVGPTHPPIHISLAMKWLKHESDYATPYTVVPRLRMHGAILLSSICLIVRWFSNYRFSDGVNSWYYSLDLQCSIINSDQE